jgi:inorganic pyrophosphatase
MVPGTLQSAKDGGDGDPLDVIVLGPAHERGALVPVRLIGVLRLRDDGERDDKLIAVRPGNPLGEIANLVELDDRHPGASQILEISFENYKGPGRIESGGFADSAEALRILDRGAASFRQEHAHP